MSPSPQSTRELLDVEDEDARQQRIHSLLESTDAASVAPPRPRQMPTLPPSTPHAVPMSDLISRAEAFLPRLAASNAELARRAAADPASVDIEHIGEGSGRHIEMNLGLGVFEQRSRPGHASSNHKQSQEPADSSSDSSSSGSEDSDSGEDEDEDTQENGDGSEDEEFPATRTSSKPRILVLDSEDHMNNDSKTGASTGP